MGFRNGAYARVWEVQAKTPNVTAVRISISKKPRGSDTYVQVFAEYCAVLGATPAKAALALKKGDRIKLLETDVEETYIKETQKKYINWNIYAFEKVTDSAEPVAAPTPAPVGALNAELDDFTGPEDEGLPF